MNEYFKNVEPYLNYTIEDFRQMDKRSRKHIKKMLDFYSKSADFDYKESKIDKKTRDHYLSLIEGSAEKLESSNKGKLRRVVEFGAKTAVGYIAIFNGIKLGEKITEQISRRYANADLSNEETASFVLAGALAMENWGKRIKEWF